MTAKKRGLGRGLDALLGPKGATTPVNVAAVAQPQPGEVLRRIKVSELQPGKYQPRREMDSSKLDELADSIRAQGVIQPILVRRLPAGNYEIVAGERRWRASQLAGLTEVPVVVRELEDRTVIAMALIENIQREDLNPLEEAEAGAGAVAPDPGIQPDPRRSGAGGGPFACGGVQPAAPARPARRRARAADRAPAGNGPCPCAADSGPGAGHQAGRGSSRAGLVGA